MRWILTSVLNNLESDCEVFRYLGIQVISAVVVVWAIEEVGRDDR